ncbi:MAG: 30S ribosomal protein S4 [Deltaproteobacteria bacterium]|jgi:small subunit ribosomal protein S4|nr:30S ribosomal protein S4 [Deltaproteobacteria bacterium]
MSRYTGPRLRVLRRLGTGDLPGLMVARGDLRRPYPPGQHGPTQRIKLSDYAIRLREKQKLRGHYGVGEKQFRRYMVQAKRAKGNTGEKLLSLLESRLDNVVFRLGLTRTIRGSRQLVAHGHIEVNGKKVDIPSFACRPGDVIAVRESSKTRERVAAEIQGPVILATPGYLERDEVGLRGTFMHLPEASDCPLDINEALVVELYAIAL